jgi:predicted site-specific integrase-resolvase
VPTTAKTTDDDNLAFLTPTKFAQRIDKSPETVRRWINAGLIRVVRVGTSHPMIPVAEIDRLTALAAPVDQP